MKTSTLALLFSALLPVAATCSDDLSSALAAGAAWGDALRRGDAPALASLLSDELRYIHSTGRLESKNDVVTALATGATAYERFELSQLHTTSIAPGVVVLTGRIDQRKLVRGNWNDARLLFHSVWRKESDHWCLVSLQTAMPPVPGP